MIHADAGTAVAEAREEAGITQKEMAQRLTVHQSQISRLEGRDGKAESKKFERYLQALGSDRALKLAEILKVEWRHLSYPSLKHPNLEVLVEIEEALQRLPGFRESPSMPQVLAGQADLLFRRLVEFAEFLDGGAYAIDTQEGRTASGRSYGQSQCGDAFPRGVQGRNRFKVDALASDTSDY